MRLSELFEATDYLDSADEWLKKYTYENLDKWPDDYILKTLVKRYPIDEDRTIYRGLNFFTKEEYEKFVTSIRSGYINISGISSWSEEKSQAEQFAVTRPTYFLNRELMQAEDERSKNFEHITGYRGVIISVSDIKGRGIDVNSSRLGHESEVILIPGKYKITGIEEIKTFKDTIEKANVESNILSLTRDAIYDQGKQNKLFNYIINKHKDDLTDKAKDHLFNISKPVDEYIIFEKRKDYDRNLKEIGQKVDVYVPYSFFEFAKKGIFTPKGEKAAQLIAQRALQEFVRTLPEFKGMTVSASQVGSMADWIGRGSEYTRAMAKHMKPTRDELDNSIKDINNIKDPKEKQKAINDYRDKMVKMLSQV